MLYLSEFNRTAHLHIILLKLLTAAQRNARLYSNGFTNIWYGQPCRNMFIRLHWWIKTAADSCLAHSWPGYNRHQRCRRLQACTRPKASYYEHIMCFSHSQWPYMACSVWLVCLNILYFIVKIIQEWYLLHNFCLAVWQMQLMGWCSLFPLCAVCMSFLIATVKKKCKYIG